MTLLILISIVIIVVVLVRLSRNEAKPKPSPTPTIKQETKKSLTEPIKKKDEPKQEIKKTTKCKEKEVNSQNVTFQNVQKNKPNWQEYKAFLTNNNISTLFHFTDQSNIESIKQHGALFSWQYCDINNIKIPRPGGDQLSRSLDIRKKIQNYVRVGFIDNHPMMFVAKNQRRIPQPILLEIDPEVIYWEGSKYADKNATRNNVIIGETIEDFKRIRFDIIKQGNYFNLTQEDKPYFQAEVLILEKIPVEFIRNINFV